MDIGPFYGFSPEQIAADKAERDRLDTEQRDYRSKEVSMRFYNAMWWW